MANYKIKRGDTLSALAARFKTTVKDLAKANNIKNPDLIYAGNSLRVPGKGDTFEPAKSGTKTGGTKTGGTKTGGTKTGGKVEGSSGAKPGQATPAMRKLAEAGRKAALGMGGYNSQGLCATGVSRAIQNAFGFKVWGNGNQIDNNLPRDKFKQVNMSLEEALKIPGLVLTWEKTSSAAGQKYGHTAITTGDGRSSVSDFIERNTLGAGGRSGFKVFMPII
ncbi:LysM peptidoglycan-binding domain-containing protein [Pyxidicoccus xibeiensis]|uniref:LysM peptidoglycan-binding domain-containing protein n=1 Tax=Pyxidicoccus xibeiensis TaxID=2906759 RepID=UPI0020A7FC1D|nr:LysM peptidoglycan-binding domain-containing protein [Pyxidicoccus xibeiensis]MCP3143108.1 LysM peptidoglycan-binding domain-containing protein [Pyxidicoccus xibeiensis]